MLFTRLCCGSSSSAFSFSLVCSYTCFFLSLCCFCSFPSCSLSSFSRSIVITHSKCFRFSPDAQNARTVAAIYDRRQLYEDIYVGEKRHMVLAYNISIDQTTRRSYNNLFPPQTYATLALVAATEQCFASLVRSGYRPLKEAEL